MSSFLASIDAGEDRLHERSLVAVQQATGKRNIVWGFLLSHERSLREQRMGTECSTQDGDGS